MSSKKRIEWVDSAKGIGILLVIIGHTVFSAKCGAVTRGVIFSFHMVLFFLLSSITFNPANSLTDFKIRTKKLFKQLIVPTIISFFIIIVIEIIKEPSILSVNYFVHKFYSLIMASGVDLNLPFVNVPRLGAAWFLVVLFCEKLLFDYLHLMVKKELLPIICVAASVVGVIIGKIQPLPLSLDISLAILPIFCIGYFLKDKIENVTAKQIFFYFTVWMLLFVVIYPKWEIRSYLELAARTYTLYPLSYLCAISGSFFICGVCKKTEKLIIAWPIKFIGRNSLYILVAHIIDEPFTYIWDVGNEWLNCLTRTAFDIGIFVIIMLLKKIKKQLTIS